MTFSVIVPVYNVEKYLHQCLDSLVNQTCKDFEVIIIDDGSTDSSGMICEEYAEKYEYIVLICQENEGLSGARNRGISEAKGEWLVFVDSDDWIKRDMFEVLKKHILSSEADCYSFNASRVNNEGEIVDQLFFAKENGQRIFKNSVRKFEFYYKEFLKYKVGWEAWGRIYRRDLVIKYGLRFVDTKQIYAEDLLFTFEYMLYVKKWIYLKEIYYNYRLRDNSLSQTIDAENMLYRISALGEEAYNFVRQKHVYIFQMFYPLLYFVLINYHLTYPLYYVRGEALVPVLDHVSERKFHRIYKRKIRKYRFLINKSMTEVVWL